MNLNGFSIKKKMGYKLEVYESGFFRKGWRWRIKSNSNGNIIAASTESYKNKKDCEANLRDIQYALNQLYGCV
jgi:uncharacterized protein YegP (UPF0339 family)